MTAQETNLANFFETTLNGILASGATSMTLTAAPTSDGTSQIAAPYYLVIDPDNASNREVVEVTAASGTTVSAMTRDKEGRHTTDPTHVDGTVVRMAVIKEMIEDVHDRVDALPTASSTTTFTNKTIDLTDNTLSATFAELNTAVSDATLVDLDDTQTLTNKTLGGVTLSGTVTGGDQEVNAVVLKDYAETKVSVTSSSGVVAINLANGNTGSITLTENITDIDFTNVPTSGISTFTLLVTQDSSSAYTIAINAVTVNGGSDVTAKTPGGGGYTMSAGNSDEDILFFLFNGTATPYMTFQQEMS